MAEVAGEVDEGRLHEPRHHARVGAAARHRSGAARRPPLLVDHRRAQRVVGARRVVAILVVVEAGPRLDDGVEVQHAELAAQLHDVERRGVDRQVDAEALPVALAEQRREQRSIVVGGDVLTQVAHTELVEQRPVTVVGVDDGESLTVEVDVAVEQRQGAAADRAEADHDHGPGDACERAGGNGRGGHANLLTGVARRCHVSAPEQSTGTAGVTRGAGDHDRVTGRYRRFPITHACARRAPRRAAPALRPRSVRAGRCGRARTARGRTPPPRRRPRLR